VARGRRVRGRDRYLPPLLDLGPLPDLLPTALGRNTSQLLLRGEGALIMSLVRRHPLITFFVLAYALSWSLESPLVFLRDFVTDTQVLVLVILASNVPSAVAIVLTAVVLGRGVLRKLLGRLLIWRVNPLWYLMVVLGPVALAGGVVALNAFVGGPALSLGMPLLGAAVFLAFSIFPGSALGEEIGWRGYALPRLQAGRSALSASLILAPIWAVWHLPLWLAGWLQGEPFRTPPLYAAFVVSAFAMSVILTWVYNSTEGSLLMMVLLHAAANLPVTLFIDELGTRATVPVLLYFGLTVGAAIMVIIVAGPKHLSRKHHKQEEPSEISPKTSVYEAQPEA
jgi:membrane protease YdiL (CAAX protease family)